MKTVRSALQNAIFLMLLATMWTAGCDEDESIRVYRAPKDPAPVVRAMPGAPIGAGPSTGETLQWTVPAGWKELPAQQMRFAAFAVNDGQPPVELTVIPLGPESADLQANVNRWEKQLGLPPTPQEKLSDVVKHVDVGALHVDVVDISAAVSASPRQRMLAAIVAHGGRVWFFKLAGPMEIVTKQKENFDAFIQSLRPAPATAASPAPQATAPQADAPTPQAAAPTPQAAKPLTSRLQKWTAPPQWREMPSQPPRMLGFQIGAGDQSAEMAITRFGANNAGSFIDNVNRWRGQLGLPPVTDPNSIEMKETVLGADGQAILVEFHNPDQKKRMLVAMASSQTDLWFFKLTGSADVVEDQRGAFATFLKSVEFGGDRDVQAKP